ncbi:hypothetical protein D3C71_1109880 [compost metagenome]
MKLWGRQFAVASTQFPLCLRPLITRCRGHHLGQVQPGHVGGRLGLGDGFVDERLRDRLPCSKADDGAVLRTLAAQQARELSGVDVGDGNGLLTHEVLRERFRGAEVACQQRQVFDDQACGMDLVGFDVLHIDAVVADVRIREGHDLLAVARVGEDFLVAGDGGVEHHFADGGAGGTNRIADKDRAVCERQDGGREVSL